MEGYRLKTLFSFFLKRPMGVKDWQLSDIYRILYLRSYIQDKFYTEKLIDFENQKFELQEYN